MYTSIPPNNYKTKDTIMTNLFKKTITLASMLSLSTCALAQLPVDGFYSKKNSFTAALSYSYKSYDEYYAGKNLVSNGLGEGIESSIVSLYSQYSITDRVAVTLTLPYISVARIDGSGETVDGLQDIGLFIKGLISEKQFENSSKFSLGGAIGITFPASDYDGNGLLSLGNTATSYKAESIIHYETPIGVFLEGKFGSSVNSSDEFDIPSALFYSAKVGYIHKYFYTHLELDLQNSISGVDIGTTEFADAGGELPETEVDYTNLLFSLYVPILEQDLGISANLSTTLDGRNANDESGFGIGLVYNFN